MVVPRQPHISPVSEQEPQQLLGAEEEHNPLADQVRYFLSVAWKRRWVVSLVLVGTLAGVIAYTLKQPKVYRAQAALVVERHRPKVLSEVKDVVDSGDSSYWSNREFYKTQYEILRSRRLAEAVVARLGLDRNLAFLGIDEERMTPTEVEEALAETDPAEVLRERTSAEQVKDSYLFYVDAESTDPNLAAEIATTVATTFRDENMAFRQRVIKTAQGDLGRLAERLQKDRDAAQDRLLTFERQHHAGTLSTRRKSADARLDLLTRRITEVNAAVAQHAAQLKAMRATERARDIFDVDYSSVLESTILQTLKLQVLQLRSELAQARVDYLDRHPKVVQLEARLKDIRDLAIKEVRNQVRAARHAHSEQVEMKAALEGEISRLREEEKELASRELEYEWLKQAADETKEVYDNVHRRLLETQMTEEVETNNIWLLEEALPPSDPVRPRVRLNVFLGLIFGIAGGILMAIFFELADNSVKSDRDVEYLLRVPALGLVPVVTDQAELDAAAKIGPDGKPEHFDPALIVYRRPKSHMAEFCRSIRTNLLFMSPERPLKVLLFTSANPWEGKTTVSSSVAITMAMGGGRTVIVDCDMRRPRTHKVFGLANRRGLSNALIGGESVVRYCLETEVPGLHLLPCGPVPPNPSELLHTRRFSEVLDELKANYDYVILDTPPILAVTDPLIAANHADGVLMVVRVGSTSKGAMLQSKRRLDAIGIPLFGCVMNQVDTERKDYHYYYYHYGGKYYHHYYGEDEAEAVS